MDEKSHKPRKIKCIDEEKMDGGIDGRMSRHGDGLVD